ncbi:MAG TPA: hypothetical protein VHU83_13110 [Bryobacteraceae bacterium]|jgi:hypothetical protein|nr:hypothetical protein [Bryobacteraceae bacterium]
MPSIHLPGNVPLPFPLLELPVALPTAFFGPNDSAIHRGDREDTGDNEARPDELGSGPAQPTVDPTSFGGTSSIRHPTSGRSSIEEELRDSDGIEIMEPSDGRLGLTNVNDVPPDDWAADTGETKTPDVEP